MSKIGIIGVPYDKKSSFMTGPSDAPDNIREVSNNGSANWCAESGRDLAGIFKDFKNMKVSKFPNDVETQMLKALENDLPIIAYGGDHSVSYPLIKATSAKNKHITLVHFDAHPDLHDEFEGDKYSHACPFARIMEDNLVHRLIQVGIRTMSPHQQSQADKYGVEVIDMKRFRQGVVPETHGEIYISLDLDVLDPAFAPGLSHHEPGGMSVREVIEVIQNLKGTVIGADIVELNPLRDFHDITAMAAFKLMKEIADKMLPRFD